MASSTSFTVSSSSSAGAAMPALATTSSSSPSTAQTSVDITYQVMEHEAALVQVESADGQDLYAWSAEFREQFGSLLGEAGGPAPVGNVEDGLADETGPVPVASPPPPF